jgi:hypothetical protein
MALGAQRIWRTASLATASVVLPLSLYACGSSSSHVASPCSSSAGKNETLIIDGAAVASGWAQASDPDLVNIGNQWYIFFTSVEDPGGSPKLNILAARLPPGVSLDADAGYWEILGSGTPIKIVSAGSTGEWDSGAAETAKFVEGYDNSAGQLVQRIYYTGWEAGSPGNYAIGFAQYNSGIWVKHPTPTLEGELPFEKLGPSTILGDQSVYYAPGPGANGAGGTWHMFYQATTDSPYLRTVLIHAESSDGVNWPTANRSMVATSPPQTSDLAPNGPYHVDVFDYNGRFYLLGWLPGAAPGYTTQGLFLTASSSLPGNVGDGDFRTWQPLLYDKFGPGWRTLNITSASLENHTLGLFGSTVEIENGRFYLFYHGVRRQDGIEFASIGRAHITPACIP